MSLFGKQPTQKEVLRNNSRNIQRNQRDLERELLQLEREEKKIIMEIKALAKKGQDGSVKVMAKELIRVRNQKEKLITMKSQLSAVNTKTKMMQANQTVAKSMVTATKAMAVSNQAMPMQQMQQTMQAYAKQSEMMEMKSEMMDDAFADADEEDEADEVMQQVLDSVGLEVGAQLSKASVSRENPMGTKQRSKADDIDVDKLLASLPDVN